MSVFYKKELTNTWICGPNKKNMSSSLPQHPILHSFVKRLQFKNFFWVDSPPTIELERTFYWVILILQIQINIKIDLKSLVKNPTCFKNHDKPTRINLILVNRLQNFQSSWSIDIGVSDFHRLTVTIRNASLCIMAIKNSHILEKNLLKNYYVRKSSSRRVWFILKYYTK